MRTIEAQFAVARQMGFNTLRVTGFTATDHYQQGNGFHTWSKIDISNSPEGNKNIQHCLIPPMRQIIKCAERQQLRVLLLLSAVESKHDHQVNLYHQVAKELRDEKGLLGIDIYNEPLYFDKGEYTKQQTATFVKDYTNAIRRGSPHLLTTIGLSHYKIVKEWDPEMMDVDFLSFHIYPYGSINLSKLERFDAKLQWIQRNITKPWIIGETGLNTAVGCEPLNYSWGDRADQLEFMSYSLQRNREAGAWGYSWWTYQDMSFPPGKVEGTCGVTDYGLVDRQDTFFLSANGYTVIGALKHRYEDLPFDSFLANDPYGTHKDHELPEVGEVYYNIDYLPEEEQVTGSVKDADGIGIPGAIVTIYNTDNRATYTTFTKPDGTFLLFTGWTNVLKKTYFEMKATAVRRSTEVATVGSISNGEGKPLDPITLHSVE